MALLDTFTDVDGTALTAHSSESGHSWIKHPNNASGSISILSNMAVKGSTTTDLSVSSYVPPSYPYSIEADAVTGTATNSQSYQIAFQIQQSGTTPTNNYYTYGWQSGLGFRLQKVVNGTSTALAAIGGGTTYSHNPTLSGTETMEVVVSDAGGGAIRIQCYVAGTLTHDLTETTFPTIGRVGIRYPGSTAGTATIGTAFTSIQADTLAFTVLSLDTPDYGVLQREIGTGNAGECAVGGKIPTGAASIELKFSDGATVVQDWTAVTSLSVAGDEWEGVIDAAFEPPAAWLGVDIRCKDSGGSILSPDTTTVPAHIGIGTLLWVIGSSSPDYAFNNPHRFDQTGASVDYPDTPNPLFSISRDHGATFALATAADCFGGNYWAAEHIGRTSRPLAVIADAVGGTTTLRWRHDDDVYGAHYAGAKAMRRFICAWEGGGNDATAAALGTSPAVPDQATANQRYTDWLDDLRAFMGNAGPGGGELPVLFCGAAGAPEKAGTGDGSAPAAGLLMRMGELALARSRTNVFFMSSQHDKLREGDGAGTHMEQSAEGEALWGRQNGLYSSYFVRGLPIPALRLTDVIVVDATHADLVYDLGSGFGTSLVVSGGGSDVSGCEVSSDNAVFVAATSATVIAPDRIRFTHADLAGSDRFLRYMDTVDAGYDTNQPLCVRDDGAIPRTAEPTFYAASSRPITVRATDAASATADLTANLATLP